MFLRWSIKVRSLLSKSSFHIPPQTPLLESQAFWGAVSTATMLIGLFFSWALHDFRWALWMSWPFWGWAIGIACRYIPAAKVIQRAIICLGWIIAGVGLYSLDRHYSPKPGAADPATFHAFYDSTSHVGSEDGFTWARNYTAVYLRSTNSSDGPMENLVLNIGLPEPLTSMHTNLPDHPSGCEVELGGPRTEIIAKGGVQEEPSGGTSESSISILRCRFVERGQTVAVKFATHDSGGVDGKILHPGQQEIPHSVRIWGAVDVRSATGLSRIDIQSRDIPAAKRF